MSQRAAVREAVVSTFHRGLVTTIAIGMVVLAADVPAASASSATPSHARSLAQGTQLGAMSDPEATPGDYFGDTVAVAGTIAVVGTPDTNSHTGNVYIYVKGSQGAWPTSPSATLDDPQSTAGDDFGFSVAVAVSGSIGTTVLVGAPGADSGAGAAYIYVDGTSGWGTAPNTTLPDPEATAGDEFGSSVGLLRWSGTTAVVGASGTRSHAGAAYVYDNGPSGWATTPVAAFSDPAATGADEFGSSVAMSAKSALIGAYGTRSSAGAAYIYASGASGWTSTPTATFSDPLATAGDKFGFSVSGDGPAAVIGAPGSLSSAGAAYIYVRPHAGVWPTSPTDTLSDPAATTGDMFGFSVSAQGPTMTAIDGVDHDAGRPGSTAAARQSAPKVPYAPRTAVIGAPGTSSGAGAAYVYVKRNSAWKSTPVTTLSDPDGTAGDSFGNSVAVFQRNGVAGAYGTGSAAGAAYVYRV